MNTKKFICDTMLELIKEKKFDKVTIRDILERAQIARSTFYSYFENKYDVINWYCHEQARQILECTGDQNWYTLSLRLNQFASKNKSFFKCMYKEDSSQSYFAYEEKFMYDYLSQACLNRTGRKVLSSEQHLAILFSVKGNLSVIREWIQKDLNLSYREISKTAYDLLPEEVRDWLENSV